jgi:hypothetical protein
MLDRMNKNLSALYRKGPGPGKISFGVLCIVPLDSKLTVLGHAPDPFSHVQWGFGLELRSVSRNDCRLV